MTKKMTALERFKKNCAFELKNDPFMYSVDAWNETFNRWVKEGMPVINLDIFGYNINTIGNESILNTF